MERKVSVWSLLSPFFASSFLLSGELLFDLDIESRIDEELNIEIDQEYQCLNEHTEDQAGGSSLKEIDSRVNIVSDKLDGYAHVAPEEYSRVSSVAVTQPEFNRGENALDQTITFSKPEVKDFPPLRIVQDPNIWIPPEPESQEEEDIWSSVCESNEGADDFKDGRDWVEPFPVISLNAKYYGCYHLKESHKKAMLEMINGRFRTVVSKLLVLGCVPLSNEYSESWLDVVTSVSWRAALLIKPNDTAKERAMDPGSYLKVKCVASGQRRQSQVVRGLVFSKSAAHKHMQTNYKNPRLLLLKGGLGDKEGGLSFSSLSSIKQERKHLNSTIEMVEMCCPNVVLVEKSVSRDVQESLQAKGITLVSDMKLPRLERIAQCTGSQILSSAEGLMNAKIKYCDTFRTEKVAEEHNFYNEGTRRPNIKTLMFFEGCPIPLGCTILLKGAQYDELKKVKFVVRHAVTLAYHLIGETSFLVDQKAILSKSHTDELGNETSNSEVSCLEESSGYVSSHASDITIFCGSQDDSSKKRVSSNFHSDSNTSYILPGSKTPISSMELSSPKLVEGITGDSFPASPSISTSLVSTNHSFKKDDLVSQTTKALPVTPSFEGFDHKMEEKHELPQKGLLSDDGLYDGWKVESSLDVSSKLSDKDSDNELELPLSDNEKTLFDPQCILILLTSRCTSKGIACKQNQLTRIKLYENSDMSLGQFLREYLLNQKNQCSTCGEPPEAHDYSYIHKKGKLFILVKRLPAEFVLSGEEGKLWMWTLCLKCNQEGSTPKPTPRVLMSSLAHHLSFGKFLDLSISNSNASSRLASCGHLLHQDCLHFYGLGSMVAMVSYSSVDIYTTCMPSPVLEFRSSNMKDLIQAVAKDVLRKGNLLFMEIMNSLQKVSSKFSSSLAKQPVKELCKIDEMLKQEIADFEGSLGKIINENGCLDHPEHQILSLNRLNQELVLELYLWDRRLQLLHSSSSIKDTNHSALEKEQSHIQTGDIHSKTNDERSVTEHSNWNTEDKSLILTEKVDVSFSPDSHSISNVGSGQVELNIKVAETLASNVTTSQSLVDDKILKTQYQGSKTCDLLDVEVTKSLGSVSDLHFDTASRPDPSSVGLDGLSTSIVSTMDNQTQNTSTFDRVSIENATQNGIVCDSYLKNEMVKHNASAGVFIKPPITELHKGVSFPPKSLPSNLKNHESWVWLPFSEAFSTYVQDLRSGSSQKFDFIYSYNPLHLSTSGELMAPERSRLHFPIDGDEKIVSSYEDELSSLIACALASLHNEYYTAGSKDKENKAKVGEFNKSSSENPDKLEPDVAVESPQESTQSLSLEDSHAESYVDPDQLPSLSLEGFFSTDPLLLSRALHPEVLLGTGNLPGKGKYSVICIYAKQFYTLRRHCCPSELDYISSLSRSKNWDAQGGKSGVAFLKTLDDRFIVKQVKKTEFDSFLMFAPQYFKHISYSLRSGSQTCLAKILGIYQVIVRQTKSGKDIRINLMVMENIFFGHIITKSYDLKGVSHSRFASKPTGTLLDQNFVKEAFLSPLFVGGKTKQRMQRAVWNDTSFLTSVNVMDYSLLLGVDQQRQEIVFGIIDYLRQYTWDKHLETWVKASLVVPKNEMPTIVSPKEYKKRFRKFVSTYIFAVPDHECPHLYMGLKKSFADAISDVSRFSYSSDSGLRKQC